MRYDQEKGRWEIDRHIPIAVLFAIMVQTVGVIIWATNFRATTESRLDMLERQIGQLSTANERLARLENISSTNAELLREIRSMVITRGAAK